MKKFRQIELAKVSRIKDRQYRDMKTGTLFVSGTRYHVSEATARRLLSVEDEKQRRYFRDHGEVTEAELKAFLKAREEQRLREEEARKQRQLDEIETVVLRDSGEFEEETVTVP